MKPRIWLYKGLWQCAVMNVKSRRIGIGYTPALAYADWEAM